jgi:hypothetical protein
MTGVSIPTLIYPEATRLLNVGREAAGFGVEPATYVSVPVVSWDPAPKVNPIADNALRGAASGPYDFQMGASWTEWSIPESPTYGDTIGQFIMGLFGDLTSTGTASTPTSTLSAAVAAGVSALPVASGGASFTAGTAIQVGTSTTAETVVVGTGSTSTSIVTASPVRFAHASATAITTVVAPFTHVFSTLNPASSSGNVSSQPASLSVIDRNQVAGSAGYWGDLFPYVCMSDMEFSGDPMGFLSWTGKGMSQPQGALAAEVVPAWSGVRAMPAWRGTSAVGGGSPNDIASWKMSFTRKVEAIPTIDGQQAVYVFSRGPLTGTFNLSYLPALDESALNYLLNNTQPSLTWTTTNGLTGAAEVSFSVTALYGAVTEAPLKVTKGLFGYDLSGTLVGNQTDTGNSGGWGVAQITLINACAAY